MSSSADFIVQFIGIFVTMAFFIVTFFLNKYEERIGPWILLAFASLFFTASEFFKAFVKNPAMSGSLFVIAMVLLFFVALFKFWYVMELTE